jgi:hypothetical protein
LVHAAGITRVNLEPRGTTTGSSISITCNATPASGDVLIACVATSGNINPAISAIIQTGVTWSVVKEEDDSDRYAYAHIWIGIVGSGAGRGVVVSLNAAANEGAVCDICEYSGIATSNYLDARSSAFGVTGPSTGSVSTTSANELWIGCIACGLSSSANQRSPTNGFSLIDGVSYSRVSLGYLEKIVNTTGTARSSVTSSRLTGYCGCIATFKAVGGGIDATPPLFGSIAYDSTVVASSVHLSCNISDNIAVSSYFYSWNNTGVWQNQTTVKVSGTPVTAIFLGTLNATVGNVVSTRVYANDSSNNWGVSSQLSLTLTSNAAVQLFSSVYTSPILGSDAKPVIIGSNRYVCTDTGWGPGSGSNSHINVYSANSTWTGLTLLSTSPFVANDFYVSSWSILPNTILMFGTNGVAAFIAEYNTSSNTWQVATNSSWLYITQVVYVPTTSLFYVLPAIPYIPYILTSTLSNILTPSNWHAIPTPSGLINWGVLYSPYYSDTLYTWLFPPSSNLEYFDTMNLTSNTFTTLMTINTNPATLYDDWPPFQNSATLAFADIEANNTGHFSIFYSTDGKSFTKTLSLPVIGSGTSGEQHCFAYPYSNSLLFVMVCQDGNTNSPGYFAFYNTSTWAPVWNHTGVICHYTESRLNLDPNGDVVVGGEGLIYASYSVFYPPPDSTSPVFGSVTADATIAGGSVQLNCVVSDNVAVSSYLYSWNNSGSWVNQTGVAVSGSPVVSGFVGVWNSVAGSVVSVRVYANDSSNNWAVSAQYNFTLSPNLTDSTSPVFGSVTANATVAGGSVQLNCAVSDDVAVSSYLYSWNNSGSWVNQTGVAVSGSPVVTGFVGVWNNVAGSVVSVRVYANDSSNNWAVSAQYNFTLSPNIITISIINPQNTTYSVTTIPVNLTFSGGIFSAAWFNVRNGSSWVYGVNQTYSTVVNIAGFVDGSYVFYAFANSSAGTASSANVAFSVSVPPVSIAIINPQNITYTVSTVPVSLSFSGGPLSQAWFNVRNGSSWVYASNQTYLSAANMLGFVNGSYTFYVYARSSGGKVSFANVNFTVGIPVSSAVLFSDGFDGGNANAWTGSYVDSGGSSIAVQSSVVHGGGYAARVTLGTRASPWWGAYYKDFSKTYSTLYVSASVRFSAIPSSGNYLELGPAMSNVGDSVEIVYVALYNNGGTIEWALVYRTNGASANYVYSLLPAPVVNTWYSLEIKFVGGSGTGEVRLYVNGVDVAHATGLTNNGVLPQEIYVGASSNVALSAIVYCDDVVADSNFINTT